MPGVWHVGFNWRESGGLTAHRRVRLDGCAQVWRDVKTVFRHLAYRLCRAKQARTAGS